VVLAVLEVRQVIIGMRELVISYLSFSSFVREIN